MLGQMLADLAKVDQWLDDAVSQEYKDQPLALSWARISKVSEELGEATQAFIAYTGQNPRKDRTDTLDDTLAELADVVITAMCAMLHLTKDGARVGMILMDKTQVVSRRMVLAKVSERRGRAVKHAPVDICDCPNPNPGRPYHCAASR